jgi:hypothetical protein
LLVYGDLERAEDCADVASDVACRLERIAHLELGIDRHAALVAAYIRLGELVQGIADAEFEKAGADEHTSLQQTGGELLLLLAHALKSSWESGFRRQTLPPWQDQLRVLAPPGQIRTKQAEGFAFYALYPESYLLAAAQSGLPHSTVVIGIRSIGTSLAAMMAAGLNAGPALTVRPSGHPFDRQLSIAPNLEERILRDRNAPFAIVDEGPGYSGSSFNCVADWLVERGIGEHQIHFFPSHGGELGGAAQEAHLRRWANANRHFVGFDEIFLNDGLLSSWVSAAVGDLTEPMEDLSGGAWRRFQDRPSTIPVDTALEKRKFLARTTGGDYLVKFSGLGAFGERKLALGQQMGQKGLTSRPVALCHGFLVEPWVAGDELQLPLKPDQVQQVGRYLAVRARQMAPHAGASLPTLFRMAAYNAGQCFGGGAEERVRNALGDPARFHPRPCCTDNRLHRWEWVVTEDNSLLKTDALDHNAAHDLIGSQDITWDIAGARVELALTHGHLAQLVEIVRESATVDLALLQAMEICYLAFQVGLWTQAAGRCGAAEQAGTAALIQSYSRRLESCVAGQHDTAEGSAGAAAAF